ncbi:predicted protein [Streptomyces iranensis]|uniref:Uncharacterized protein n=1 Tax=Streptomyces iranensis TaxID=576784 RepID=A0A061A6Z0_9ACTN|nr:predicted protein [Streptomyces iranensis]
MASQDGVGKCASALGVLFPAVEAGQDSDDVAGERHGQHSPGRHARGIASPPATQCFEEVAGRQLSGEADPGPVRFLCGLGGIDAQHRDFRRVKTFQRCSVAVA